MGRSRLFAIGDLHLSFTSEKPMDIFGFGWEKHHEKIRANWRRVVGENDTVLVLGDISWALKFEDSLADLAWVHELPGTKVLLRGNHDFWWSSIGKLRGLYDDMIFLQNDSYVTDGRAICGSRGWLTPSDANYSEKTDERIYNRELIRLKMALESARRSGAQEIIVGLHYPPTAQPGSESGFKRLIAEFGAKKVVYGHLHGREAFKKGIKGRHDGTEYCLASADYVNFTPLLISE
ncbi:MAG: metallophosphoesterase [Clostridiales Family XIII bacterium]|nr:metallophosphoesterase [Clostridiales Family XIII bacterium]